MFISLLPFLGRLFLLCGALARPASLASRNPVLGADSRSGQTRVSSERVPEPDFARADLQHKIFCVTAAPRTRQGCRVGVVDDCVAEHVGEQGRAAGPRARVATEPHGAARTTRGAEASASEHCMQRRFIARRTRQRVAVPELGRGLCRRYFGWCCCCSDVDRKPVWAPPKRTRVQHELTGAGVEAQESRVSA